MPDHKHHRDWIARAPGSGSLERFEAYFCGHGYDAHRHDSYAIGQTIAGVQSFHYQGSLRHSLPGDMIVLHPDEVHDGQAGTDDGFRYRIVYLEPARLQAVLGGQALPFIRDGVSRDPRLQAASRVLLHATASDPLAEDDALFDLATALQLAAGARPRSTTPDYRAAETARAFIDDALRGAVTLAQLEQQSGRDRWSLSRDFRTLFGTSPYRYLTMRRLDLVRRLLLQGTSLVDAALLAGFTDQSHMTRHFGKTFGISPYRWLRIRRAQAF